MRVSNQGPGEQVEQLDVMVDVEPKATRPASGSSTSTSSALADCHMPPWAQGLSVAADVTLVCVEQQVAAEPVQGANPAEQRIDGGAQVARRGR